MNEQSQRSSSKGGRPPKPGPRTRVNVWVPEPLAELLKQDAAGQQISVADRLAEILAGYYSSQEAMPKAS
jgi:hypothetical protein